MKNFIKKNIHFINKLFFFLFKIKVFKKVLDEKFLYYKFLNITVKKVLLLKKLYINICVDDSYYQQAYVTMFSALQNLDPKYFPIVIIFTKDKKINKYFKKLEKIFLCKTITYNVKKYDKYFKNQKQDDFVLKYVSIITYYRLLVFKILPKKIDKIIYLDSDLIIDCDLSILYEEVGDFDLFAAVAEIHSLKYSDKILNHLKFYKEFDKFKQNKFRCPYFNAGFYIANLKFSKFLNIFEKMLSFLKNHPNPVYADQDVLNFIFGQLYYKNIVYLNPRYNVFCDIDYSLYKEDIYYKKEDIEKSFKKPFVYHFAGSRKPWTISKPINFSNKWWEYAKKCDINIKQIYEKKVENII